MRFPFHFSTGGKFAFFLFSWARYHTKYLRFPRKGHTEGRADFLVCPGFTVSLKLPWGALWRKSIVIAIALNHSHCENIFFLQNILREIETIYSETDPTAIDAELLEWKMPSKQIRSRTCTVLVMYITCPSAKNIKVTCGGKSSANCHPLLLLQRLSPTRMGNSTRWHHRPSCSTSGQPAEWNQFLFCSWKQAYAMPMELKSVQEH